jgi:hypothetical protein
MAQLRKMVYRDQGMAMGFIYNEQDIVKVIIVKWLRCVGQLFRTHEQNSYGLLTLYKPGGIRRVRTPAVRWLDSHEEDLKIVNLRN